MYTDIPFWLSLVFMLGGLAALAWSSDFFVDGAAAVAKLLGISPFIIGMVIIGFGTSAPELSVALQSFAWGSTDLTLGDIIGCAISNILLLLGLAAVIRPIKLDKTTQKREIPFYVVVILTFIALILSARFSSGSIGRIGGFILLGLFGVLLYFTISTARKNMSKASIRTI